jgi:hypothetical protein
VRWINLSRVKEIDKGKETRHRFEADPASKLGGFSVNGLFVAMGVVSPELGTDESSGWVRSKWIRWRWSYF